MNDLTYQLVRFRLPRNTCLTAHSFVTVRTAAWLSVRSCQWCGLIEPQRLTTDASFYERIDYRDEP